MSADHDRILTETIARHFASASIGEDSIDLGVAGLHIACWVNSVSESAGSVSASLFFRLWGGRLGAAPIFASVSGYGGSAVEAIVTGGCNWACVFGPVLERALSGAEAESAWPLEVTSHGRRFVGAIDGLDRAMLPAGAGDGDVTGITAGARARLGGDPWLLPRVVESGNLPPLPLDQASVLSLFCLDSLGRRIVEVKVNGADWTPASAALQGAPPAAQGGAALLRELAVLVPEGPAVPPTRSLLERTLAGAVKQSRRLTSWPGWRAHGGALGAPAREEDLALLESRVGRLPEDYRAFLLDVEAAGAGPGYGLLPPTGAAQERLAAGTFAWVDGAEPSVEPGGVLALAHAGCDVMWLLVVSGPRRGEVWVDSGASDGLVRRVAPSFTAWFHSWIDALVRDDAFVQWDGSGCSTPAVLTKMLESRDANGSPPEDARAALQAMPVETLRIWSGGGPYFEPRAPLDPCQACTTLVSDLGGDINVFAPGTSPRQGRPDVPGLFSTLSRWWSSKS